MCIYRILHVQILWYHIPKCVFQREPEAKPPRKWEVVDASYYGGGGAGGIKPMTVSAFSVPIIGPSINAQFGSSPRMIFSVSKSTQNKS